MRKCTGSQFCECPECFAVKHGKKANGPKCAVCGSKKSVDYHSVGNVGISQSLPLCESCKPNASVSISGDELEYAPRACSAWSRLEDFLCSDEDLSPKQVRADLEADGVDVDAFLSKIKDTINRHTQNASHEPAREKGLTT